MPGYFLKVSVIDRTVYGRGSTSSLAPNFCAATMPAPIFISPCVSVGPSSTTSARLPVTRSGCSTKIGDAASITRRALGLTERMLSRSLSIAAGSAESILLMMTTSAIRRLASAG